MSVHTQENQTNDKELIAQFKKGSVSAYEELIARYETKVFNLSMRLTRNQEDAEEVLQDVFTTIFRKIDSFQGKSAFSSWVYRVTSNAAFMLLRKKRQKPTLALEDLTPASRQHYLEDSHFEHTGDNMSVTRELKKVIEGAVHCLPEQYREIFILRDVDGLSNKEVGKTLKLSIPAVKSRLHRSREMLKKQLTPYWNEFSGKTTQAAPIPMRLVANS